jgi:hypothetical protein
LVEVVVLGATVELDTAGELLFVSEESLDLYVGDASDVATGIVLGELLGLFTGNTPGEALGVVLGELLGL